MKILFCYVIMAFATCSAICEQDGHSIRIFPPMPERIYFDSEDMPTEGDAFHIRVGGNEWIKSNIIHKDHTGFFTFERDVKRIGDSTEYQKHWQCPYCHIFWPENVACQNPKCPSRYGR